MKKVLIILALLLSIFAVEILVRYGLNFPTYGVECKVYDAGKRNDRTIMYKPYSEYLTVEGGVEVYKRNNLGLPGTDVKTDVNNKYIYILGSSFVESYPVAPQKMPSSIFKGLLKDIQIEVLNLGASGHSAPDSYNRAMYFQNICKPYLIFLIIESINENEVYINDKDYYTSNKFGKPDNSFTTKFLMNLRNTSSFLNLLIQSYKEKMDFGSPKEVMQKYDSNESNNVSAKTREEYRLLLKNYKDSFGDKFILVFTGGDEKQSRIIQDLCEELGINYSIKNILGEKRYRINGGGHLNEEGCKVLGGLLYEAYSKYYGQSIQ